MDLIFFVVQRVGDRPNGTTSILNGIYTKKNDNNAHADEISPWVE